jgi:hypothetical protein
LFRVLTLREFSLLLLLFSAIIFCTLQSYANNFLYSEAQILPQQPSSQPALGVKITSHETGQNVPTGELTITGTSTDTPDKECQVYTDLNDIKPMQKVKAIGPGGNNDYSKWTYTYDSAYQLIQNGTNNLTSKISCIDTPASNFTKWNSINVMGVDGLAGLPQPSITHVVGNTTNSTDTILSQSLAQTPPPLITPPPLQPAESVVNSNDDAPAKSNDDDEEEEDSDEDDRSLFANEEEDEEDEEENNEQDNNSQDEDEADNNDDEDNSEEDTSDDDGDDCGIGDEGFPFC